jgi:Dehydrogenases with different specificities (related to short-chain alcohol dehydrogenases)
MTESRVDLHESLDGQVALVTGATRGIGEQIAADLTDLGATVYAGARDTSDVTADDQRAVRLDVTDDEEIAAATDRIREEMGGLDVLVNNAGIFPEAGPLHEASTEDLDRTLAVNLRGPTVVTKHCLPLMLERDGPRVVTLSSGLGRFTGGEMGSSYPPYRLSKVGVAGLTAYLHAEYADGGLLANAVVPGWVQTDMGGPEAPRSVVEGADTSVWLSQFAPDSPAGRLWKDREVVDW